MSGPDTEEPSMWAWKDGYQRGFARGWDAGLDQAVTALRGRVSSELLVQLAELAASPQAPPDPRLDALLRPAEEATERRGERG